MEIVIFHYHSGETGWLPTNLVNQDHYDNPELVAHHGQNPPEPCERCKVYEAAILDMPYESGEVNKVVEPCMCTVPAVIARDKANGINYPETWVCGYCGAIHHESDELPARDKAEIWLKIAEAAREVLK